VRRLYVESNVEIRIEIHVRMFCEETPQATSIRKALKGRHQ
jgi:hypothetical protein